MTTIFRGPLRVDTYPQDTNSWWRTWVANPTVLRIPIVTPPFGDAVANADWDVLRLLDPKVDLRTWFGRIPPQVVQPVGDQFFDLTPRAYDFPQTLRHWTWKYVLELIGQDKFPPGENFTEIPNQGYREPYRSWLWNYNPNLIGKDKFPPGEMFTDRPVLATVPIPPTLALWLLEEELAVPFKQLDWPLPKGPAPIEQTWASWYNKNLIGKDQLPPGEEYTLRPDPVTWYQDWYSNPLTLRTVVTTPFNQDDWPIPKTFAPIEQTWTWKYNPNLIGQDKLPFRQQDWPVPYPVQWYKDWAVWLLEEELAKPFYQLDWPNPYPVQWYRDWSLNLQEYTLRPRPINQFDWPNPKAYSPIEQSWYWKYNPNLVGQDQLPTGEIYTQRPDPVIWYQYWFNNPVELRTVVTAPFSQIDWPNPTPVQWYRSWEAWYNYNLIGQDKFPPGEILYNLPPIGPPPPVPSWAVWLLEEELALPFNQLYWPNPYPVQWYRDWSQNLQEYTLRPRPINQYDWRLPATPQPIEQSWYWSYNKNLIGQDQLPVGEIYTLRPDPVLWYRDWYQNLQQSSLGVVIPPFAQYYWPNPFPVTWYQNQTSSEVLYFPTPTPLPFNQTDWPLPILVVPTPQGFVEYSYFMPATIIPEGPVGGGKQLPEVEWDIANQKWVQRQIQYKSSVDRHNAAVRLGRMGGLIGGKNRWK